MHGITSDSLRRRIDRAEARAPGLTRWVREHRAWLAVVMLPTLLVTFYYTVFAANQYVSEAHFMVRSVSAPSSAIGGLGQALTMVGASSPSQTDAMSVGDYLSSHDAVAALEQRLDLVAMFRRPEADLLSRLRPADPTPERLLDYYRDKVEVRHQSETGLTMVTVKGFRPADAHAILSAMLDLGEQRVNQLNDRAMQSSLAAARRQVAEAEAGLGAAQRRLTAFRQGRRNIDPSATGQAQVGLVSALQAQLAAARAQAAALSATLAANSPQVVTANRRVAALAAQVGAQEGRLTGGANNIAGNIGGFEELQLRSQFAARRYEAAAASLEKAREQARQQQLFLVRVVEPNMPVKALYPKSLKTILTVFFGLVIIYGIGWLIAAGMKEHAA